jgi:hypothetical protein
LERAVDELIVAAIHHGLSEGEIRRLVASRLEATDEEESRDE